MGIKKEAPSLFCFGSHQALPTACLLYKSIGFRVRIAVCIRPCVGLRAVSGFDDDLFCEDILLFKQHLERTLYLIQRELALMESLENRDQHIGVMLKIVQVEVVFIVVVSAFVGVEIALQILLHVAILRFCAQHRFILAEIKGSDNRRAGRGEHRTRADSSTEQNEKGNSDADPDEDLLVFLKKLLDLVGHLFTELLAGILCGSPGGLRTGISSGGIFLLDVLLLVVLVHVLLLHLRMLLLISLILDVYKRQELCVGNLVNGGFDRLDFAHALLNGNAAFNRREESLCTARNILKGTGDGRFLPERVEARLVVFKNPPCRSGMYVIKAVSYTHLDAQQTAKTLQGFKRNTGSTTLNSACLLYTSRCV